MNHLDPNPAENNTDNPQSRLQEVQDNITLEFEYAERELRKNPEQKLLERKELIAKYKGLRPSTHFYDAEKDFGIVPEKIPEIESALFVIRVLQQQGHEAYIVGGAVRDLIEGVSPKDFDVVTSMEPSDIVKIFRKNYSHILKIDMHGKFVIARLTFKKRFARDKKLEIEISTLRDYSDKIKDNPDLQNVYSDSAESDAHRRDFLINSMYYDPYHNLIIDFFDGYKCSHHYNLKHTGQLGQVVCVGGNAKANLTYDPLRVLRALRLSASMNYKMREQEKQAVILAEHTSPLRNPGRDKEERQKYEYEKTFTFGAGLRAFELLIRYNIRSPYTLRLKKAFATLADNKSEFVPQIREEFMQAVFQAKDRLQLLIEQKTNYGLTLNAKLGKNIEGYLVKHSPILLMYLWSILQTDYRVSTGDERAKTSFQNASLLFISVLAELQQLKKRYAKHPNKDAFKKKFEDSFAARSSRNDKKNRNRRDVLADNNIVRKNPLFQQIVEQKIGRVEEAKTCSEILKYATKLALFDYNPTEHDFSDPNLRQGFTIYIGYLQLFQVANLNSQRIKGLIHRYYLTLKHKGRDLSRNKIHAYGELIKILARPYLNILLTSDLQQIYYSSPLRLLEVENLLELADEVYPQNHQIKPKLDVVALAQAKLNSGK